MEFSGDDDDDVLRGYFPVRSRKVDYVWDGWDAALIVSKREKAHQAVNRDIYGTNVPEKEDIARVLSLEECEILLGKRKDSEISKTEWRDSITRQVYLLLQPYRKKEEDSHLIDLSFRKGRPKDYYCDREREAYEAFPSSAMEGGDSNWLFMIAKAVAALTLQAMSYVGFCTLEKLLPESAYKIVRESYFNVVVRFVLSVFDMAHCDPCVAVAEGKVKVEKISILREHDICDIIQQCEGCAENKGFESLRKGIMGMDIFRQSGRVRVTQARTRCWIMFKVFIKAPVTHAFKKALANLALRMESCCRMPLSHKGELNNVVEWTTRRDVYPWAFPFDPDKWDDISQSDIISAMREVLKYVPLKSDLISFYHYHHHHCYFCVGNQEDCKMQLTLELSRPKCYHILDNLTLEALKDVKIQELHRFVDDVSSDESIAEDAKTMLYDFANGIIDGLYVLSGFKGDAEAIIFPISRGSFGPCTDELRGVINIADNERRMQCQRFISVQHILFGLSFSRVGDNVRMLNDRPRCSGGLHSKLSMFSIYKLSRIAADRLGDKEVGLEHLVLAIFFGKQEDDPIKRVELEYGSSLFFDDNAFDPELVDCEKQRLLLFFGESILHNGGLKSSCTECDAKSLEYSAVFKEFLPENCFDGALVKCCGLVVMEKLHEALKCGGLRLSPIREES
ncbi:unnamed protein product [Camellia sinensis]